MATFFALAALVANVATVALLVVWITGRNRPDGPFAFLSGSTMWLAALVAIVATLGSLYLSEIVHLIPCRFCWFQRIAMYPLAVILPIAAYRKDGMARLYAAILATIGLGIAAYHRLIQAFPDLDSGSCSTTGPACSAALIMKFEFVTIPYMAFSAFALILTLLWADRLNERSHNHQPSVTTDDRT